MNKKIFFLSLVMLFLLPCMFSCSKRDKLTANTMLVSIEPRADFDIAVGESRALSAIVRNAKNEIINPSNASWSVVDSDGAADTLGIFDPKNGVDTIFTAIAPGSGQIILTCEGVQTSVNITVQ